MSQTSVLAPVAGRAVRLEDVPDPVFSAGMVGYGAAIATALTVVIIIVAIVFTNLQQKVEAEDGE